MTLQGLRLHPAPDMTDVAPVGSVGLVDGRGGFSEGRDGRCSLLGQGITALSNGGPVIRRPRSGLCQTCGRKAPQADISPASVDGDA